MSKFHNVNLEPLGYGVILSPILEEEKIITANNISTKATHAKSEQIWRGECEVVRVGDKVEYLKPGDKVYMNMETRNKVPFLHKKHQLLWTVEAAVFAKITAESKIIM